MRCARRPVSDRNALQGSDGQHVHPPLRGGGVKHGIGDDGGTQTVVEVGHSLDDVAVDEGVKFVACSRTALRMWPS